MPVRALLTRPMIACALAVIASTAALAAEPAPTVSAAHAKVVQAIKAKPAFKAAIAELDREHERWVENIVRLTEVPAPPYKEAARAKLYAEMFGAAGLSEVEIDP
jgi:tripeptide aminopeptidase